MCVLVCVCARFATIFSSQKWQAGADPRRMHHDVTASRRRAEGSPLLLLLLPLLHGQQGIFGAT